MAINKDTLEVEFPEKGGCSITVYDRKRDLNIVFTYPEPIDLETNSKFYMDDISNRMIEIIVQYENTTIDSILNNK